jgi:hypothetical protein
MTQTPPCKFLRTKKMFIPALANENASGDGGLQESAHCWCNRTLTEVGPDDQPVGRQVCRADRSCFRE